MTPPFLSLILLGLGLCRIAGAQNYAEVDANRIKAGFNSAGDMLINLNGGSGLSATVNSNAVSFATANLWAGGLDAGSQLHMSAQTYRQNGTDFWPGPLDTTITCSDSSTIAAYDRVWKITQDQIDSFLLYLNGNPMPGYVIPSVILNWPGNGNSLSYQGHYLAPFHDADGDGVYNPQAGDYPVIRGDVAVYFMYNDHHCTQPHGETQGLPLSLEIHGLAYAYRCSDSALQHTVFLHYHIISRSTFTYSNVHLGHWSDIDLNGSSGDFLGTDSLLDAAYYYDAGPSAWGTMLLNRPLKHSMSYQNNFTGQGNPVNAADYYDLLQSVYADGTSLLYGNTQNPTPMIWTGDPATQSGWVDNTSSDKRSIISTGPMTLMPGMHFDFDLAYVFSRDYSNTPGLSTTLLRQRMQAIKAYYNASVSIPCNANVNGIAAQVADNTRLLLYPNPAGEELQVNLHGEKMTAYRIIDITGKTVLEEKEINTTEKRISTGHLSAGIYLLQVTGEQQLYTSRFVKN